MNLLNFQAPNKPGHGELYARSMANWDAFYAGVEYQSDLAMREVDAETIRMFANYKVPMPLDFARSCPTKYRPYGFIAGPKAIPQANQSDYAKERAFSLKQSESDKEDIQSAIDATDARRKALGSKTPIEYYTGRNVRGTRLFSRPVTIPMQDSVEPDAPGGGDDVYEEAY